MAASQITLKLLCKESKDSANVFSYWQTCTNRVYQVTFGFHLSSFGVMLCIADLKQVIVQLPATTEATALPPPGIHGEITLMFSYWVLACMFGFEYEWVSNRLDRRKCHPALYLPPWQSCHMLQSLPHLPYPPKLDFLQASFKIFLAESISRAKCITDIAILNSASAKRNIILQIAKTAGGCYI